MNIQIKITSTLLIALSIILYSCNTTEPGDSAELKLTVEDISCTEAWIKITASGISSQSVINIKTDDKLIKQVSAAGTSIDSIIYIDSLLPNKEYRFSASNGKSNPAEASARTLDTTSHDFIWEEYTFGDYTSILRDVVVINEKNIWAVGEIYLKGETDAYNAVHWDGVKWELKRIPVQDYGGNYFFTQLSSIHAFGSNDIWFSGYADLIQWDGSSFKSRAFFMKDVPFTGQVNKIWGTNPGYIYCSGNAGSIYNYSGIIWTKIESKVETNLLDIYGDGENLFIAGYQDFKPSVLLKYKNGNLEKVVEEITTEYNPDRISGGIKSVWVKRKHLFTLSWYDLFRSSVDTKGEAESYWGGDINLWGSNIVRGNDVNDIFTAGNNGRLWHFNGVSWRNYDEISKTEDRLLSLSTKGNIIAVAGYRYINGIENFTVIHVGRR